MAPKPLKGSSTVAGMKPASHLQLGCQVSGWVRRRGLSLSDEARQPRAYGLDDLATQIIDLRNIADVYQIRIKAGDCTNCRALRYEKMFLRYKCPATQLRQLHAVAHPSARCARKLHVDMEARLPSGRTYDREVPELACV